MTVTQRQRGDTVASDHRGLGVLDLGQCLRRLAASPVGRIAFRSHGETVILPVNHVLDDTVIAFRTRWDSTLAAAVNDESIAFEVDHYDPSSHTGWSVLVKGIASTVYDDAACERLESLLGVPWAGPEDEIFWTLIRPEEISGRELSASRGECGCC